MYRHQEPSQAQIEYEYAQLGILIGARRTKNDECYAWILPSKDGNPMGHQSWEREASFRAAVRAFAGRVPDADDHTAWDYIQIVPVRSLDAYRSGNDGAQGWRHRETGITIPDYCRQTGGTPELWTRENWIEQDRAVTIADGSPVLDYIINDWIE